MDRKHENEFTRRHFVSLLGATGAALGLPLGAGADATPAADADRVIPGFEAPASAHESADEWQPYSDRRVRVGIAGYGYCKFGAAFGFQNHPNVEVVAVTDLIPQRRDELAERCGCDTTYPSCEEMIKDDRIEAVFLATDAPSHARLSIAALRHGKHVGTAVPAVWGRDQMDLADELLETVRATRLKYMMFETSCFHAPLYAWHKRYLAGQLGKVVYCEGEYYHFNAEALPGYNPATNDVDQEGWRNGAPPQWYPTHATAYYVGVTGGAFTEVSCLGMPSHLPRFQPGNNPYENPFGTEVALYRTSDGGMARMAESRDMPAAKGEMGRVYGQQDLEGGVNTARPPLPPGVMAGGHGGSHGNLMNEFVEAIVQERDPWLDVAHALNMTVPGIIAHESALRDGEWMKVPRFHL